MLTAICTSATGEENNLVSNSTTRIEVEASLGLLQSVLAHGRVACWRIAYQGANDQHGPWLVVVYAGCNHIPALTGTPVASRNLDRGQVCAEISRQLVNEEALAIRSLFVIIISKSIA